MGGAEFQPFLLRAVDELEQATGIPGGDDLRLGRTDVLHLAFEKFVCHFRLREIVNARAAATPTGLGQLDEFQTRDRLQKLAWLRGNLLAMTQMAGLVIRDHEWSSRLPSPLNGERD